MNMGWRLANPGEALFLSWALLFQVVFSL